MMPEIDTSQVLKICIQLSLPLEKLVIVWEFGRVHARIHNIHPKTMLIIDFVCRGRVGKFALLKDEAIRQELETSGAENHYSTPRQTAKDETAKSRC